MIASLLLAAALLTPGPVQLPAYSPATVVARVIAVCAVLSASEPAPHRSNNVDRRRSAVVIDATTVHVVPVMLTTQLRR